MGKKKQQAEATPEAEITTNEPTIEAPPETATAPEPVPEAEPQKKAKAKKKAKTVSGVATLADLTAAYAEHMLDEGKSDGTVSSYKMELRTAMTELGAETPVAEITTDRVRQYFDCPRVTKLRSGKRKSQLSIDKTRRVLRLALCFAAERGIIAQAPIPETAKA